MLVKKFSNRSTTVINFCKKITAEIKLCLGDLEVHTLYHIKTRYRGQFSGKKLKKHFNLEVLRITEKGGSTLNVYHRVHCCFWISLVRCCLKLCEVFLHTVLKFQHLKTIIILHTKHDSQYLISICNKEAVLLARPETY